jgi:hypothetical protein
MVPRKKKLAAEADAGNVASSAADKIAGLLALIATKDMETDEAG